MEIYNFGENLRRIRTIKRKSQDEKQWIVDDDSETDPTKVKKNEKK